MSPLEWDGPEWRKVRDAKLLVWMAGNADAVRTVLALSAISETWDDLIDERGKPSEHDIHHAFTCALVYLNSNPFFVKHHAAITAIVLTGINAWMDANELERSEERDQRALSFYIRNFCYEMVSLCAALAGGFDHLRKISLEMRLFFQHESYFSWEKRHEVD